MNSSVSFENTQNAFSLKDDKALRHSLWLFRFLHHPYLVKLGARFSLLALKLKLPVKGLIRNTVFSQFCAGETLEESKPVVDNLARRHIGSILDYSVEGKGEKEDFENTKAEIIRIIGLAAKNPAIPYTCLKMTGIAPFYLLQKITLKKSFNRNDQAAYDEALLRLDAICRESKQMNVPIYIDAEESWIQGAIDVMTEEMMWKHNKDSAIVNTTLQMYRHDRLSYLRNIISEARTRKCFAGIKLVRGAYLEKENARAKEKNYPTPMQSNKIATDHDFNAAVDCCLENIDVVTLCAGTHNEESTMHLIERMKELGLPNNHPHVFCSQLYGMSDHISFNLADGGYNVTKYLPYGPINAVLPYLIRRAEENTAIAGQMGRELKLLHEEKKRRQERRAFLHRKLDSRKLKLQQ
jgi:proline dehydrogenase